MKLSKMVRKPKGAAMVEYAILLGAVTLIALVGMSTLGHKTSDIIGSLATVLPGVHADDNANITSGKLIETTTTGTGTAATLSLDATTVQANNETERLGNNTGLGAGLDLLVVEP